MSDAIPPGVRSTLRVLAVIASELADSTAVKRASAKSEIASPRKRTSRGFPSAARSHSEVRQPHDVEPTG